MNTGYRKITSKAMSPTPVQGNLPPKSTEVFLKDVFKGMVLFWSNGGSGIPEQTEAQGTILAAIL
jgi:hypothetical protein